MMTSRWLIGPRLRTLEQTHERHASWLELFFDLVVVVAIAQLAATFERDPAWNGFLVTAGLFLPVFIAWQGFTAYADRFDTDDLVFRLAAFAQMIALLALAIQIPDVAVGRHSGFAIAFALLRGVLVLLYADAYRTVVIARPLTRRYGIAYALTASAWFLSAFLEASQAVVIWGAAIALDLSMPWVSMRLHRSVPTDPAHLPERFGLFTIIVLGELVVAVGLGAAEAVWSRLAVTLGILGFASGSSLWWLYFEGIERRSLPRIPIRIVTYAYGHLPLLGGLMFVAAGVAVLVHDAGGPHAAPGLWALCLGAGTTVASLTLTQSQTIGFLQHRRATARGLAAGGLVVTPLAHDALLSSSLAATILMALVVYEAVTCKPERSPNQG